MNVKQGVQPRPPGPGTRRAGSSKIDLATREVVGELAIDEVLRRALRVAPDGNFLVGEVFFPIRKIPMPHRFPAAGTASTRRR